MRILMLGWEYPPFISGGLGTACHGLTRAMSHMGLEILFVLPVAVEAEAAVGPHRPARSPESQSARQGDGAERVSFKAVPSAVMSPYQLVGGAGQLAANAQASRQRRLRLLGTGAPGGYEGDLIRRIAEYARRCLEMIHDEPFEVIHAHDWVTFPAGMAIAAHSGRPLVVHVHSTEFDRSGEQVSRAVYDIERAGMHAASLVLAVSNLTKRTIVTRYGVAEAKVRVIHNGIDQSHPVRTPGPLPRHEKVVLFLGRITMQKGPEYFVRAAQRVLTKLADVKFVVAGWGDLAPQVIEQVAAMGLGRNVRFTGFLPTGEVQRAYQMADVYVMPSVSEPFGLTALEAIRQGVPVIISHSSGAAEVLTRGALKVEFWDVDELANKIVAVLRHPELAEMLRRDGAAAISGLTWELAAEKCMGAYDEIVGGDETVMRN